MPGRDLDLGTLSPLLTFACQRSLKHPSFVSICFSFFKFCLYALLKKADNMRSSKYNKWSVQTLKSYLTKDVEIASLSIQ